MEITRDDSDRTTHLLTLMKKDESGPEILGYLAATTTGLSLAKSIVELVIAIIKARSEGIKRGDRPTDPLEVLVRGFTL